ncbi:MAG: ABC transporter ATP-binding protein [Actinomycetota bacterium]|nr:ABC transporter ATP-binding protein [Actinomycetota bacterium]
MDDSPFLEFNNVSVNFNTEQMDVLALSDFNLSVLENEFICIVGESGCGKTTALNVAAGLIQPTSGYIKFKGKEIKGPDASRAVVFQMDAVFPWMTVQENIAFGPKSQNKSQSEVNSLVDQYLNLIGLQEFKSAWPKNLSGGMRKRVDLARAYASNPSMLLMDEPFGALDFIMKENLQEQSRKLFNLDKKTIIFITHDLEEALFLGDRLVVMTSRPGTIAKIVKCDFGEERTFALRSQPEFINMRVELRKFMESK